jgi:autotransporter-associated beta strand protein
MSRASAPTPNLHSVPKPRFPSCGFAHAVLAAFLLVPAQSAEVTLTGNDTSNSSITSFNGNLGRWSNGSAPSAGNTYTNAAYLLRTPNSGASHTFAGDSLTLSRSSSALGRLLLKGPEACTVVADNLILGGGLLDLGVGNGTITNTLAGGLTIQPGARNYINVSGSATAGTGGETLNVTAIVSGSGDAQIGGIAGMAQLEGLTVPTAAASNSAGTVKLSSANPFTGRFIIAGSPVNSTRGGLQLAHLNAVEHATVELATANSGSVPPISFLASANTGPFRIGAIEGAATQPLQDTNGAAVSVEIGGNNASSTFTGGFAGPGNLIKTGSGVLSLTGSNNYSGNTTVSSGTLILSGSTLHDTSIITIEAGAVLQLNHSETDAVAQLILDGVSQPDGTYNATNTGGLISGTGSILVGDPPPLQSKYRSTTPWAAYGGEAAPPTPAGSYFTVPFMPVSETPTANSLKIAGDAQAAAIHYSASDAAVVRIAANALRDDIQRVTGIAPAVSTVAPSASEAILIGTVGTSPLIDSLVSAEKIDVSAIQGKWEAYTASVVENPLPGVTRALVIAGSDRRGTAFGVFALSESMGVSPWYFWGDVPTPQKTALHIAGSHTQSSPGVKYRGIFLNDEDWGLQPWAAQTFEPEVGNIGPKTYSTIYELLLRLHANVIWPAMHEFPVETTPFYLVPGNQEAADDYAIVISTSHHEPMMRNSHEYDTSVLGPYNYWTNRENIYNFWEERVIETAGSENIYTIGMRGRDDSGMLAPPGTTNVQRAAKLQNEIIPDQRQMISDHVNDDASEIPQIFIPYKETLVQYQSGLQLPDDVTIVWPDDNHGYIRQLSNPAERARSGGSGVYYHLSYWGVPTSYLWFCTTPPGMTCSEMIKAWDFEAHKYWLVNVGDLKPMEIGTDFFLRLARDPEAFRNFDQSAYLTQWAARTFGVTHADAIAAVLEEYYRLNIVKRPEHLSRTNTGFSHVKNGDEASLRLEAFAALTADADAIYDQLPANQKPAFYGMVLFQIRAAEQVNRRNILAERSRLWQDQNRAATNSLAAEAQAAQAALSAELTFYNEVNADGKWNKMLNPDLGASGWWRETQNPFIAPAYGSHSPAASATLGVAIEGSATPLEAGTSGELPLFTRPADPSYFIDVFNQGAAAMTWSAEADKPWITLSRTNGSADARILVSIDWNTAPRGHAVPGTITITGAGSQRTVNLRAFYPMDLNLAALPEAVEHNGSVTIEAEDFSQRIDRADGTGWRLQDQATASDDGMTILPFTTPSINPATLPGDAPSLTYRFHTFNKGPIKIRTQCLPTHKITSDHPGLRYAISLNNDTPRIVDINAIEYSAAWNVNTLRAASIGVSNHEISKAGVQAVRIWMIDAGVVLDKLTVEIAPGRFEAEDLSIYNSNTPTVTYTDPPASDGAGLHIRSTAVNHFATVVIPNVNAGDYQLTARVKKWTSRGIVQMAVAQDPSGPFTNIGDPYDLYHPTELYTDLETLPLTFSSDGDKYLRFTVVGKNSSASNFWVLLDVISLEPVPPAAGAPILDWRNAYFGTHENSGDAADLADPDGDGIPNLIEYATGSFPTMPNASPVSAARNGNHLALIFNRARDATDIIYQVFAGNDLPPATPIWSSETTPYPGGSEPFIPTTVADPQAIGDSARRFLILKVERP